jgi:hypothetical protein
MNWVIVFWISLMNPDGSVSMNDYQMIMHEPHFERRSDCELYALQRKDEYSQILYDQILGMTDYVGFEMIDDPVCKIFNEKTMELIDGGSDI